MVVAGVILVVVGAVVLVLIVAGVVTVAVILVVIVAEASGSCHRRRSLAHTLLCWSPVVCERQRAGVLNPFCSEDVKGSIGCHLSQDLAVGSCQT